MKLTNTQKLTYYLLQFTWGIIMNIFGLIGAVAMIATGHKPQNHGGAIMFITKKKNWGGLSLGMFSFVCANAGKHTKDHEFGHSLQNCKWGPAFPFVIAIPSFIRYWQFTLNEKKGIPNEEAYDDAWFEGQATALGTEYIDKW